MFISKGGILLALKFSSHPSFSDFLILFGSSIFEVNKVFERENRFFKKEYLVQTQAFYQKWGSFTIVAARFAPIARTFAPFVAGIGAMEYKRFISFNIIGAIAWVFTFILAGHFFGNLPVVKRNFHIVIFGVIFVSVLPMLIPWIKSRFKVQA